MTDAPDPGIDIWIDPDVPEGWRDAFARVALAELGWRLVSDRDEAAAAVDATLPTPTAYYGDWAITLTDSGRDETICRLTDELADAHALADIAIEARDDARHRRVEVDTATDLRGDLRDLRGEAGRADTKSSILAAMVGAGGLAGINALTMPTVTVPVLAVGGAAVITAVGVIGALLAVLRPRMARPGTNTLVTQATAESASVDAARIRATCPDLHALVTERSTLREIVAAKYRLIRHAVTATGAAVALAVIATALHIITG